MSNHLSYIAALCAAGLVAAALVTGPAVAAGAPVWRAGVWTDGTSSPAYANGRLFVGTADGLVGRDPATGAIITNERSGPVSTTPAVICDFDSESERPAKVIIGSRDGILHAGELRALDASHGRPMFDAVLPGGSAAPPLVVDGRVLAATRSGEVLAYDGPDS